MKKKAGPTKKCNFSGCKSTTKRLDKRYRRFCSFHTDKATIDLALRRIYRNMKSRVDGKSGHNRGNWAGKAILPKDVFVSWARNHPIFLSLYKRWVMSGFDRKLAPSVNRMRSAKGYTLDNMEWMTNSQNSGLAGSVRKLKQRNEIYNLLGVNTNV